MRLDSETISKIFIYSCLSFIAGVFFGRPLAQASGLGWPIVISFFIFLIFLIFLKTKDKKIIAFFCLCFFILGFFRGAGSCDRIADNPLEALYGSRIQSICRIIEEPEIDDARQKLVVSVEEVFQKPVLGKAKILTYLPRFPEYQYADKIKITGTLEGPPVFPDFDYNDYLQKKRIYGLVFDPDIQIISTERYKNIFSYWQAKIIDFKQSLRSSIYRGFPASEQYLLSALILGDKGKLPDDLKETLNKAGIRHLSAISGMHITIITGILMLFFLGLGLWRQQAFVATMLCVLFFILLTGAQPSAVRAGIFSFLYFLGQALGRRSDSSRVILFGAVVMLGINPSYLEEIGFQLSFLAVMGINYLYPIIFSWLKKIPKRLQIRSILAVTLSAQIFTLPILVYNFGYISLVAPLTNILVLPILPFVLVLGFMSALMGIISHYLALIFIFPAQILLSYIIQISQFFAGYRFSSIHLKTSWIFIIIFYLFLAYLVRNWKRKHSFRIINPWGFWDET